MIKATITPSISCAVVKLNEDASLSIYSGTVEMGQGSETVLAQIAGKELGIRAAEDTSSRRRHRRRALRSDDFVEPLDFSHG